MLFILLMPIALAAEDEIFDGWKYSGETIVANDIVFSYQFLEDPNRLRLRYGDLYKTFEVDDLTESFGDPAISVCTKGLEELFVLANRWN